MATGGDTTDIDARIRALEASLRKGSLPEIGHVLGQRYTLVERIGSGGFGTGWRTWPGMSTGRERDVAVKILHGQPVNEASRRHRFKRGADIMATLDHPHIVPVLDPGREDDAWAWFVMKRIDGQDLRWAVLDGRIGPRQARWSGTGTRRPRSSGGHWRGRWRKRRRGRRPPAAPSSTPRGPTAPPCPWPSSRPATSGWAAPTVWATATNTSGTG
ncbi:MAG: hypothetical protein D6798_08850 [Deltaproteobacteria bacterium]|nr:MAG: hypothetical protein D6798_08850 [Deltaproteobacteria bacterium]